MKVGILEAIKIFAGSEKPDYYKRMLAKYKCDIYELEKMAKETAVGVMLTALPLKPETCKEEDGRTHFYCPGCEADISDWQDGWSFCPYCGQAVAFPEEE